MEGLISFLAVLVDRTINYVIILGCLGIGAWIVRLSKELDAFRQSLENMLGIRRDEIRITKNLSMKQQNTAVNKREDTYEQRKQFHGLCKTYMMITQLIPLFPLLGILGTVAGLYLQVRTQDSQAIYAALSLALASTFYGLVAAIGLKIMETTMLSPKINELDAQFEENEIRYSDAIAAKNFSEDRE